MQNALSEVRTVTDDTTALLTDALSFTKPKSRVESPRCTHEFDKIKSCYNGKRTTVDGIWIITRLLSRDVIVFPIHSQIMTQTIPFWTGFHCLLSEKRPDVTVVEYPPIIDAKSTDMSTVPMAMKKMYWYVNGLWPRGCYSSIWSTTLCNNPAGKMVKAWLRPHILRLGGFHSLSTFIFAFGKLWADGGLRDLLLTLMFMPVTQLYKCW